MSAVPSPNPADDLETGRRFGNYVVRECVGRGGMARVYRAEHAALGKVVALKVMDQERLDDPQWRARFVREAQSAAVVKHPHIVDITDVGVEGTVPFLVMEFLVGVDLAAHLAEVGPISETQMADLLLPIAAGLGFAHDAGVVHRDIKPSNIFLARSPDGSLVPKLLDFGIAKSSLPDVRETGMQTATGQIIGTPMFMAPEALDGARYTTDRSDQYSLGLVMYQCLAGRAPFSEQTSFSLLRAVATGRLSPLRSLRPGLSRAAEKLVVRALDLDPARRFPHVRELGSALFALASPRSRVLWESAFGAPTTGGWAVTAGLSWPRGVPRKQLRPALALLGGVALLASVGLLLQLRRPAAAPAAHAGAAPLGTATPLTAQVSVLRPAPTGAEAVPATHAARVSLVTPAEAKADAEARNAAALSDAASKRRDAARAHAGHGAPPSRNGDTVRNAPAQREQRELEELFPALGRGPAPAPSGAAPSSPLIPE